MTAAATAAGGGGGRHMETRWPSPCVDSTVLPPLAQPRLACSPDIQRPTAQLDIQTHNGIVFQVQNRFSAGTSPAEGAHPSPRCFHERPNSARKSHLPSSLSSTPVGFKVACQPAFKCEVRSQDEGVSGELEDPTAGIMRHVVQVPGP